MNASAERRVRYLMTVDVDPNAAANAKKMADTVGKGYEEANRRAKQAAAEQQKADEERAKKFSDAYDKMIGKVDELGKNQWKIHQQNADMIQKQIDGAAKYGDAILVEMKRVNDNLRRNESAFTKFVAEETHRRETIQTDSLQRLVNQNDAAQARMRSAEMTRSEGFVEMGRGISALVESMAVMGVLSEENTEALLRQVVVIKTLSTAAQGALDIYKGWHKAMVAYEAAVKAATAAELALASARAASSSAGGATFKSDGFGGVIKTAGAAGAGGAGAGGLAPAISGLSASVVALPAAIAAALATVGYAGATAAGAMNVGGAGDAMAGAGWYDPDTIFGQAEGIRSAMSITEFVSGNSYETIQAQDAARASERQTARMEQQRNARLIAEQGLIDRHVGGARDQDMMQQQIRQQHEANQMRIARMEGPEAVTSLTYQHLGQAMNRLQETRQMVSGADAMTPGAIQRAEQERAYQAQKEAVSQVIALREQALNLERQAHQEAMQSVQMETRELENQLAIEKQKEQVAEQRLMTSKERFGGLDEATQRQMISAMQKAQGGGDLTREERALLRSVGTERAGEFARSGDLAAADAAGFDSVFGAEERSQMASAVGEQTRLKVEVEAKRQLTVQMEADMDALVKSVADTVQGLQDDFEKRFEQMIKRELDQRAGQRNNVATNQPPSR